MIAENERPSFLAELFAKKAKVLEIGDTTRKDVAGALREIDRQIMQVCEGNLLIGEGVTKSGTED